MTHFLDVVNNVSKMNTKIRRIANKCRAVCEQFAFSQDAVEYDYFRSDDLHCMCGVASFFLKNVVEKENISINCRLASAIDMGHCFTEIGGQVIDLTATQFGSDKKVMFKELAEYEQWLGLGKSRIIKRLNWGTGQSPRKNVLDKLLKLYYNPE